MSQNFEESPISDNKMDISDTTTASQESPTDGDQILRPNIEQSAKSTDDNELQKSSTAISNLTQHSNNLAYTTRSNRDLDNRKNNSFTLEEDENVTNNTSTTSMMHDSRSGFTLASSHPLMSPNESDSENGHRTKHFHYPDVVPEREPLRLANPLPKSKANTNSSSSTTTTSRFNQTLDVINGGLENVSLTSPSKSESLQGMSSDYLSSDESEPDLSQYQATVTPTFQSVALVSNSFMRPIDNAIPLTQRKITLTSELMSDDVSSVDSLSNRSFDEDIENNLVSASVSSSVLDETGNDIDKDDDNEVACSLPDDQIPTYTAAEESRDLRNWQKITLPDGRTRDIDMKVIEPYKRVLSHGGYLNAGGHNAIVVFSACHLPDRSRTDYHYVMDNLFLYVVKTLEQLVTEDYVLIYLHGGSSRGNVPPFPWLKKCYQLLDRRLRKSLKNLFMVHPTFWLKSVVWMARPFISSKFWRKLVYIRSLEELYHSVPVEKAAVPEKVKKYDVKYA
ncbi:Protein prune like 2 [Pseudolycoriella hygida]|uniref:Protein prune like 2 n=1 Tax=Pseudolycoriella hygida TaxID=35572 RepID=A0A9Q0N122_9DIPT|nr:Protein prune like 2 [Pseudolycoriella hygida]